MHSSDAMALPPPRWWLLGREERERLGGVGLDPPHGAWVLPGGLWLCSRMCKVRVPLPMCKRTCACLLLGHCFP